MIFILLYTWKFLKIHLLLMIIFCIIEKHGQYSKKIIEEIINIGDSNDIFGYFL